jgi:hypothetical protein
MLDYASTSPKARFLRNNARRSRGSTVTDLLVPFVRDVLALEHSGSNDVSASMST